MVLRLLAFVVVSGIVRSHSKECADNESCDSNDHIEWDSEDLEVTIPTQNSGTAFDKGELALLTSLRRYTLVNETRKAALSAIRELHYRLIQSQQVEVSSGQGGDAAVAKLIAGRGHLKVVAACLVIRDKAGRPVGNFTHGFWVDGGAGSLQKLQNGGLDVDGSVPSVAAAILAALATYDNYRLQLAAIKVPVPLVRVDSDDSTNAVSSRDSGDYSSHVDKIDKKKANSQKKRKKQKKKMKKKQPGIVQQSAISLLGKQFLCIATSKRLGQWPPQTHACAGLV
jgi:hypothetical protein